MEHFQNALELYEYYQNKLGIAVTQLMIAGVYRRQGESEKELNQLQLSLRLAKESGSKTPLAWTLNSTAAHYQEKGDFNKAQEYCFQALDILEEIGRPDNIVMMLGQIAELNSLLGERGKIPPLIEKIESYENRYPDIDIILNSKYVKAIYLKSSNRSRDKNDAAKIFDQIVNDEVTDHEFRMKSMMHLAELLLDELNQYGEDEVFQEINDLINRFIKFADEQNSVRPQVRALIIKAKLSIVKKDLQAATVLLDEASKNAEEFNLGELTVEIQKEKHILLDSFEDMQKMIESNASYSDRMNKMRIMDYVKQAQDLVNRQTRS
jgi:tetratricopeptide (TPR) repeat protein